MAHKTLRTVLCQPAAGCAVKEIGCFRKHDNLHAMHERKHGCSVSSKEPRVNTCRLYTPDAADELTRLYYSGVGTPDKNNTTIKQKPERTLLKTPTSQSTNQHSNNKHRLSSKQMKTTNTTTATTTITTT